MSAIQPDTIIQGDCMEILSKVREPFADLIFADPPFNIGYKYDVYEDRKAYDEYHAWTKKWMEVCAKKALKPTGSFWIAIGDEYAAEVRLIGNSLGLHLRNWVIWHYTFGQNTKRKFARSHAHLFYFTKHPQDFTFLEDAVRVPSDRLSEYRDKRANLVGKIPHDVWTEFPRVCGTFAERRCWHPCQMPETLLARIIRACTKPGDVVLDPFAGSGSTLAVAKKTGRQYVGIELSAKYVAKVEERLKAVRPLSAIEGEAGPDWPEPHVQELQAMYAEAAVATDKLRKNGPLLQSFVQQFNWRIENAGGTYGYSAEEVWEKLERLRKAAKLPRIRTHVAEPARPPVRPFAGTLFDRAGENDVRTKQGSRRTHP